MNMQQAAPRSSGNGFGRRRGEREVGNRPDNKLQSGKSNAGSRTGGHGISPRDRMVYISSCFLGHQVDVQVKDGSIYSGIFYATNGEKDLGVILKMARMTKDGSSRGQKANADSVSKAPVKTLVIPSREFVQVIAKDVSVTRDGFIDEFQSQRQHDIMIDSSISRNQNVEVERELEPWVPDDDDPQRPELEHVFDLPRKNRASWNQFEVNATLFGVKSTFHEEIYTTKLEQGPQMREREREALRIAKEIESEDTHDLHLAEERGRQLSDKFDIDEETRYSSVYRGKVVDDSGCGEASDDGLVDSCNDETFGDSSTSATKSPCDWSKGKFNDVARVASSPCALDQAQSSQSNAGGDINRSGSSDQTWQPLLMNASTASESRYSRSKGNKRSEHVGISDANECSEKQDIIEGTPLPRSEDPSSSLTVKKGDSDREKSPHANLQTPARVSLKTNQKSNNSSSESLEIPVSAKPHGETQTANYLGRPVGSASSRSDRAVVNAPALSPSSSVGSLSSERSTLNPHAKEFKLNPNAKSFQPLHSPVRPPSPAAEASYYYPPNNPTVAQLPGMPMGMPPPAFGHQHVMFNPQAPPQGYLPPNAPQYTQQMLVHPRQFVYMPPAYHQPDMPYRGREY